MAMNDRGRYRAARAAKNWPPSEKGPFSQSKKSRGLTCSLEVGCRAPLDFQSIYRFKGHRLMYDIYILRKTSRAMYKLFEIITRAIRLETDVIEDIVVLELKVWIVRAVVARLNRLNLPLLCVLIIMVMVMVMVMKVMMVVLMVW